MKQKIFVLDDDENACQLAEKVLTKAGYKVKTQTRAIGTTQSIKTFAPDLVLLDVMMPALSGDSLVGIIHKMIKPRPKIIFYSNKMEDELKELVEKSGADGYVCKVAGPTTLVETVSSMLSGK
jgi:DNA-binding response OmpR family regulator